MKLGYLRAMAVVIPIYTTKCARKLNLKLVVISLLWWIVGVIILILVYVIRVYLELVVRLGGFPPSS